MQVLLVEDNDAIATRVVDGLRREGFEVRWVATGAEALRQPPPEVVLLDIGLPDVDGYEVCRRLRTSHPDVSIVLLTARCAEEDRILGFELGADDYVVKPFGLRELAARLRALARRRGPSGYHSDVVSAGPLQIDTRKFTVALSGRAIDVTPTELRLLALLASEPGAVLRRHSILEAVWGHPWYGPTKTLDTHVASLRRKLGGPEWIEAVRGIGFRLVPQE